MEKQGIPRESYLKPRLSRVTDAELELARSMRGKGQQWKAIGTALGKDALSVRNACLGRRVVSLGTLHKCEPWTTAEVAEIVYAREELRLSYKAIAHRLGPERTTYAVGSRYRKELCSREGYEAVPNVNYTAEEDSLILELRHAQRLPWAEIQSQIPGRSIPGLKNRYYAYLLPAKEADNSVETGKDDSKAEGRQ